MSTLIRCPRCKSETDASASKPGSIIKCAHCRGDMRVPEAAKEPASSTRPGGRQSTLFRKMSGATVPGQRGRGVAVPGGAGGRGASERGRDLSGLYVGGGILALIGVVIVVGVMMKGKGGEPEKKSGPRKEVAGKPPIAAPPPPPAPPVEPPKPPDQRKSGPPSSWEPDAASYVRSGVQPVPAEPANEKLAIDVIRAKNTKLVLQSPFRYLPWIINSLISEDRELARNALQLLYDFCDERKEFDSKGKNLIDMSWVNDAEYRGYTYSFWSTTWWPERAHKLPDAPGSKDAVNKMDWVALTRQLQGGAYHDETTPQGTAFRKVKNLGKAAWPKLAEMIDHDELPLGRTAAQVLIELTQQKIPLPNETNRVEVKNAWLAWIAKQN